MTKLNQESTTIHVENSNDQSKASFGAATGAIIDTSALNNI